MATVRPLAEADLAQAQRIMRTAFGTFLGASDLDTFWTDFDYIYGRHGAPHVRSFAIDDEDGRLAGSNFATRWGSLGFFGPLSIRPDLWDRGLAQPLVAAVTAAFDEWGLAHAGLCTFPQSTKHIHLYRKFGYNPRFLTPIMAAPAATGALPENAR
jgi:RimJ/RimL family protein N-acetyltransferase